MNIQLPKIITVAFILSGALIMLGATGAISPASAAGVVVNGNAKVTNYSQVTLTVTPPPGSTEMRFQNESGPLSGWEASAATKQWTLSAGTGVKMVSVQFRDAVSKISIPPTVKDTIIFDSIIDTSFNPASASYPGSVNFANSAALLTAATAANAVAVYPNTGPNAGKTVTVGTFDNGNGNTDIKILRYNTDGTLDIQYVFDHAGFDDRGNAVAIQSDGKIVVVGTCSRSAGVTDVCALRLNSNGTIDTGFGVNGVIDYIGSGKDSGNAVAIDPVSNNIIVAGSYNSDYPFAWILSFDSNGVKSATFGGVQGDIAFEDGIAHAVTIQSDQKIVVVGTHINEDPATLLPDGTTSAWVMRLNSDGTEDTLTFNPASPSSPGNNFFGTAGVHSANAAAVDPTSNKIVVVGTYNGSQAWVLQLNPDGTLDPTFNYVGSVTLDGPIATSGNSVAIQADGKIVMVGTNDLGAGNSSVLVVRLSNTGNIDDTTFLDTTFNDGSYDYTFGATGKYSGRGVALQPDGKIIVAGIGNASQFFAGSTSMLTLRLHEKTLPINVTVNGSGTVAAYPGTLSGGTGDFVPGSTITLTATAGVGATFSGWLVNGSSLVCPGTGTCSVTMDGPKNVIANFTAPLVTLDVNVVGTGSVNGTVSCLSGACSFPLPYGTPVSLTAAPAWYASFVGWGGDCSGTGICSPVLTQNRSVTASFAPQQNVMLQSATPLYYPTLLSAYQSPGWTSAAFSALAMNFPEGPLTLDRTVTFTIDGGKAPGFAPSTGGYTTLVGPLTVKSGRVNVKMFIIKSI